MKKISTISAVRMAEDVCNFGKDKLGSCQGDCWCRSRDTEDRLSIDNAGNCPGQHRCRADLLDTLHPEEFPESFNPLLQEGRDRLDGAVIAGETGAPVDDDTVGFFEGNKKVVPDGINAIRNNCIMMDGNGSLFKESDDRLPAGIRINGPGRGNGNNGPRDLERPDVGMAHDRSDVPCHRY